MPAVVSAAPDPTSPPAWRRRSLRTPLALLLVMSLVAVACSESAVPFATTTVPRVVGSPGLEETLERLAAWVSDNTLPPPAMPAALREHLVAATAIGSDLEFTTAEAIVGGSRVAVAVAGNNRVLLVESVPDSAQWEVVGADLPASGRSAWFGSGPRFVVVLGSDARPEGDVTAEWRPAGSDPWRNEADSIHLLTADPQTGAGAIVGITRHLLVPVPYPVSTVSSVQVALPAGSPDWISSTMTTGGPETTLEVLRAVTGLPFEGYIATQFGGGLSTGPGFIEIVDALGGLEIVLAEAIDLFDTPVQAGFFPAGRQTLTGVTTLLLARERRAQPNGDLDRKYHGALIIRAALAQAQRAGWLALPDLLAILEPHVRTDLDPAALLTLAAVALRLDTDAVSPAVAPSRQTVQDLTTGTCVPTDDLPCPEWRDGYLLEVPGAFPTLPSPAAMLFRDLADGRRDGFAGLDHSTWPQPGPADVAAVTESQAGYPSGANNLYLTVGGDDLAAVGPATTGRNGPILLLDGAGSIPPVTREEAVRLAPRRVYVVGSPDRVPEATVDELRALFPDAALVERVAGADRAATAVAMSEAVFSPGVDTVVVTLADPFPHAVQASAAATVLRGPVLFLPADEITEAVGQELTRLAPRRIVVVGDEITEGVLTTLEGFATEVVRVGGVGSDLSVGLSGVMYPDPTPVNTVYVTIPGEHAWWAAGATALRNDPGPLLVVAPDAVPEAVLTELARLDLSTIVLPRIVVVAPPGSVTPAVLADLVRFLEP